ncbi:MAG: hypothetical protein AAF919_09855 [Pseudomonadota bacterium]
MPFATFLIEETGAVTVDWVVISAIALGLTLAATGFLSVSTGQSVNALFTTIDENDFDNTVEVVSSWGL